jgi:hypothetical protein
MFQASHSAVAAYRCLDEASMLTFRLGAIEESRPRWIRLHRVCLHARQRNTFSILPFCPETDRVTQLPFFQVYNQTQLEAEHVVAMECLDKHGVPVVGNSLTLTGMTLRNAPHRKLK